MKLCLHHNDARQRSHLIKRQRRQAVSRGKAQCKRCKMPWPGRRQSAQITAPFAFAIGGDQNRKTLVRFFARLRELCLERRLRVTLDFSEVDVTTVPGMLLFVAELDRIKRILGSDFSVRIEQVKSRRVNQLLHQVGVYSLCDVNQPGLQEENFDESVKHWRYATGERMNEQTNKAFGNIEGRLSPELARGMWKSLSEAVVNSAQHAYIAPRGVNGPRMGHARWWMFSQELDGQLTVAVCDLGIGIPRSLPHNWSPSILDRMLAGFTSGGPDIRAIRAALEVGASSTNQSHRGKGLPQIWNTLRSAENGSITIMSNRAQLIWNGADKKEFSLEFATSIHGTIIQWTVDATKEKQTVESSDEE